MTEPGDDWDARSGRLASELLDAGRRERASESARDRATLVLLASITSSSAAAANTGTWTAGLKWLGISVVLLGMGGGLWRIAVRGPDEGGRPAHVSQPPARATQHEVLDVNARGAGPSATASSAAPLTSAPLPRESLPSAAPSLPASRSAAAIRGATDPRLAQELLALNRARAAVAEGAPEQALSTLDAVPGGFQVLSLEASLVRVDALRGAGKRDSARALSEQLLRAHPDGPYTERLRFLAAALGSSATQPLPSSRSATPGDAR